MSFSQSKISDQKVFLITLDGLRWQELFLGADSLLVKNKNYVKQPEKLYNWAWREKPKDRRLALMPFIWNEVIEMGQIFGNRNLGSKVNLSNGMWFSYPGYNEILTGKADDQNIFSNDKIPNPNETILEQFAKTYDPVKVAAFGVEVCPVAPRRTADLAVAVGVVGCPVSPRETAEWTGLQYFQ